MTAITSSIVLSQAKQKTPRPGSMTETLNFTLKIYKIAIFNTKYAYYKYLELTQARGSLDSIELFISMTLRVAA